MSNQNHKEAGIAETLMGAMCKRMSIEIKGIFTSHALEGKIYSLCQIHQNPITFGSIVLDMHICLGILLQPVLRFPKFSNDSNESP